MRDAFLHELGLRIRRLREAAGMTQVMLGKAAATTHVTIGRIEDGLQPTNILILRGIARGLGMRLAELLDEGTPTEELAARIPRDLLDQLARAEPHQLELIRGQLAMFARNRELEAALAGRSATLKKVPERARVKKHGGKQ